MSDLKVLQYQSTPLTVEAIRLNKKNRFRVAGLLDDADVVIDVDADGKETEWALQVVHNRGKKTEKVVFAHTGWWVYRTVGRNVWNVADDELFRTRFPNALA